MKMLRRRSEHFCCPNASIVSKSSNKRIFTSICIPPISFLFLHFYNAKTATPTKRPFLLIEYLFGIYIGDFPPLVITLTNEYLCHKPGRGIFAHSFLFCKQFRIKFRSHTFYCIGHPISCKHTLQCDGCEPFIFHTVKL